VTRKNSFGRIDRARSTRRKRRCKRLILLKKGGGGAGICTYSAAVSKLARMRGFLVKLLMGTTFDVFIDSSRLHPSAPRSATLVEALWRRREGLPGALPIVLNVIQRSVGRRDAAEELRDVLETAQLGVCARTFNIGCLGLRLSVTVTFLCISLGRRAYPLCARGLAASLLSSR